MTDEQINIAIAEACGWKSIGRAWDSIRTIIIQDAWESPSGEIRTLRNYCNDLNAMHEAEKGLPEKHKRTFAFMLAQVLDTSPTVDLDDQFLNIHATAIQRAEAFLKTIGKWEEK